MDLTFKVEGMAELKRELDSLPKNVAKRGASKAVRACANVILKAARAKVPVDTGTLKRSLAIKVLNKKRDAMEVAALIGPRVKYRTSRTKAKSKYNEKLRNDGWYGFLVEHGTRHSKPQPFLRPAFDENKTAAQKAMFDVLAETLAALTGGANG